MDGTLDYYARIAADLEINAIIGVSGVDADPFVPGPSTYTAACTCDTQLAGYHRTSCGVYR